MFDEYLKKLENLAIAGSVDASRRLGNIYHDGAGVKRDFAKAIEWYQKAALLGDRWSLSRISDMS